MDRKLKIKLIIFAVLASVGIFIIAYTGVENKAKLKQIEQQKTEELRMQEEARKKEEDKRKRELEEKKKKEEELEKKNDTALSNFYEKRYKQALQLIEEVLKEDPNNYKAYNIKGIALSYSGSFEAGMEAIDKSLELKPDFAYARFNKALAYELFGHYEESLKWYDKALEIEQYPWSYYGKASIYGRKGDLQNTIACLTKAIELDPKTKEAAKTEEDFNNVRKYQEFNDLINK